MGIVRERVFGLIVVLFASACGFPRPADVGPDDAQPNGPGYRLLAVTPAIATTGDTIWLEGTFGDSATVQFPGGAMQAAMVLGAHRATVVVPEAATAGELTVVTGGIAIGPVPFRRTSFALGLQPFRIAYEQTDGARQSPALRIARSAATATVIKNSLYVIGGLDGSGGALNSVERAAINADGTIDTFELVGDIALDQARSGHTSVIIGNALYVMGGAGRGGATNSVERATINADGSLGNFAAASNVSLATARSGHASAVVGNAVYVIGGARSDGARLASIEQAAIQADGSLGAFITIDANLAQPRSSHTVELVGDVLYVIGGDPSGGATTGNVERAPIRGDGSLGPFAATGATLMSSRSGHGSAVIGGALYVIGGSTSGGTSRDIERAPIGASGSLGPFAAVSTIALSAVRSGQTIASVGTLLYAIGGRGTGGAMASVEHASLNADSALGAITDLGVSLVLERTHHTTTVIRDSLYVIGHTSGQNTIERASIRPDGSLERFASVSSVAPVTSRSGHSVAVIRKSLYLIGGALTAELASIERAAINADGSLGPFMTAPVSLQEARSGHASIIVGNFLYVFGGLGADHKRVASVERAVINDDGTLGPFAIVPGLALTESRNYLTTIVTDTHAYTIGGLDDAGATGLVEQAAIGIDGSLGAFMSVGSLGVPRAAHTNIVVGDVLYVVGGLSGAGHIRPIEKTTIGADGTLGSLSVSLESSANRARHTATAAGDFLYLVGGEIEMTNGSTVIPLSLAGATLR